MNAIRQALSDVKFRIPKAILEKTFLSYNAYGRIYSNTSIDDHILNNVIKARVLVDCNMIGGTQVQIPLAGLGRENPTDRSTVIRIPKTLTQGKSINSVLHVAFFSTGSLSAMNANVANSACSTTATMNATGAAFSSFDNIPIVSTARVQLIGENVIYIKDSINLTPNCFLVCVLANDEEMSNIPMRAFRYFSNLVEYAVKSYVYNELIINLDQGQLQGGVSIGIFKDIISGYADAEQNYRDYLNDNWEKIAFMADDQTYSRYIKMVYGGLK